jgi:phage gpG-like protein
MTTETSGTFIKVGDIEAALKKVAMMMHAGMITSFDVSGSDSPWEPLKYRKGRPLVDKGTLRASGVATSGADFAQVTAGRGIASAAIHQYGGVTHPRVTEKSRAFFWAKWFETGETMWKAMALKYKVGDTMEIRIPARPYLAWIPEEVARYQEVLGKALFTLEPITSTKAPS